MNCHYCGTELPDNAFFCRHCGTRRKPADQPKTPSAVPAPEVPAEAVDPFAFPKPKAPPVFDEETFSWKPTAAEFPEKKPVSTPEEAFPVITPAAPVQLPRLLLPVKRGLLKMILLGLVTLGIYPVVIWSRIVTEVNIAASRYDGRRTMSYFGMVMLSPITLGIYGLVWMHEFSDRIGRELCRREVDYRFGARDFWFWNFLCMILAVAAALASYLILQEVYYPVLALLAVACLIGPFVYVHKLMKAMNLLNADFNAHG